MAQSDPEPAPAAEDPTDSKVTAASEDTGASTDSAASKDSEDSKGAEGAAEKEPEEDPAARARRSTRAFEWTCGWLTLLAGAFVVSGMVQNDAKFGGLAWLGATVVIICVLALIALYVGCARDKVTLRTRLFGRVDLFQVSTVLVVLAVICGLTVPSDNHSALSLLLPWALTYWIYGMKPPADSTPTP
ncbi:hypothetical protein [Kribbella sp. NPDC004536]|uniref:hypothetical protein n=1 Tax=Kribbella sp. NPDC004536 TaxID=3364106 RepID=UPI003674A8A1